MADPTDAGAPPPADPTVQDLIRQASQKYGVPPELALAIGEQESGFNPTLTNPQAVNGEHATGTFQLLPSTAKGLGVDPNDPAQNIDGGVKYLRQLMDQHQGDLNRVVGAYGGVKTNTTYVPSVLARIPRFQAQVASEPAPEATELPVGTSTPWGTTSVASEPVPASLGGPPPRTGASPETPASPAQKPVTYARRASAKGGAGTVTASEVPEVATPPPAPGAPETWGDWAIRHGKELSLQVDPGTPQGRRNLAGGIGGAIGGSLGAPTAAVSGPVGPATTAALGAGIAGGLEAGSEKLIQRLTGAQPLNHPLFPWADQPKPPVEGTPPPSVKDIASATLAGASEQTAYEIGGHVVMWPFKVAGSRIAGTQVAKAAAEGLSKDKAATLGALRDGLDAAQALVRQTASRTRQTLASATSATRAGLSATAQTAHDLVKGATEKGAVQKTGAETLAKTGLTEAQEAAAAGQAAARAPYDQLVGQPPPSGAEAGRKVVDVLYGDTGAAAAARDQAGQAVTAAAAKGGEVDITRLKAEARRILEAEIQPPAEAFPRVAPEAAEGAEGLTDAEIAKATGGRLTPERVAKMRAANDPKLADIEEAIRSQSPEAQLAAAQGEATKDVLKHPAMGVLGRILNAEDSVPFSAAHQFKRDLDNAVGARWDETVKTRVLGITKHLRTQLRQAMADTGNAAYDQATAHYARIEKLFSKGIGPRVRKLAIDDPESVIRMINPGQPTRTQMLVEALTTQAEAGGGDAGRLQGQRALEAVQEAWVHRRIIKGPDGLAKMGQRIDALPADFRAAFLNDPKSRRILDNLKLISTAYNVAVQEGKRGIGAAKAAATGGKEAVGELAAQRTAAARETSNQMMSGAREERADILDQTRASNARLKEQVAEGVPEAKRDLRTGQEHFQGQEAALARSSLVHHGGAGDVPDILRAIVLAPKGSIWGAISAYRLMQGPTAQDLVRWAAYSEGKGALGSGTSRLVKAITSDRPAEALADLARLSGVLGPATDLAIEGQRPGQKKPATPAPAVATPPPQR